MTDRQAISVLECMAIDMTGALSRIREGDSAADVIRRKLDAIDVAQTSLQTKIEEEKLSMQKMDFGIKENSIQNAEFFLSKRNGRTTPNERVNDEHYLDIAIRGAKRLNENQNNQADK